MSARERVAQGPPPEHLAGFPAYRVGAGEELHRAHRRDRGPWWFGNDGGGRFDLPAPRGTCYLASEPLAALRERLGIVLGGEAFVPASLLEDAVVSRLHVPDERSLADLQDRAASSYGVTRELESMTPYAVPQAWARGFAGAGYQGVRYGPRFSTGEVSAVALFDDEGERDWDVDAEPTPAGQVPGAPTGVPVPKRDELTVVRTPRTRARR
ncbi:MAG TPA: RES family NAD+ phosphorylase [Segeticoccus sp.]|uniref:RES family NAD+ phosphorylase n=1 Tax=Segeticoccus sp. TaxID=2706531 RepID=UPI002D7F93CE|nr:RES family NAD+ phosphorylase [Segeticoccus sp.]HET8601263.1 RES family NAD+ phosphorylase [Segeticoccus sp.]